MQTFLWISIFLITFCIMEFMAWFTHKYVMHGFMWSVHKDHHHKKHDSWWERNDLFFIFYALISIGCFLLWRYEGFWAGLPIGLGIFAYGVAYFMVHDIFIHQRFKLFRNADGWYGKALRRAHKMHHKHLGKHDGESFGMLFPPIKYFKQAKAQVKK
ncbi:sterol desaturase family protein [Dokdonia pacifica]|uniref:Beta-carotene 3-hydroxylase n=1 Tax=Dokdonia pacifica TaxID=1627892 RepID=A0A239BCT9_9FLAO|nr:sterol desaturase family protein [Dokdonia pacifica]SNS05519.1 beta-carotene 3-hydroxylase [Dokdonia pacifica]